MSQPQKILVIKLGALGDFVQALGLMRAIRDHHPGADITLLTTAPFYTFGKQCGYFDHIWIDDRPKWHQPGKWVTLREKLNNGHFDRVYDLQNNDRTALYFKLFKDKPEWVGTAKGASHRNTSPQRTAGHAFDGHCQTLALAGIENIAVDDLAWIKGDISAFDINEPYILFVPGCAPSRPEKRWPAENFGVLARTLYGWGYLPVIIGSKSEKPLAEEILKACPQARDLTGETTIFDIAVLARKASAAFGNDTGPMHVIGPTGCPSYVLFSRHSDPAKHAPKGANIQTYTSHELAELSPGTVLETLKARDFKKVSFQKPSSGA